MSKNGTSKICLKKIEKFINNRLLLVTNSEKNNIEKILLRKHEPSRVDNSLILILKRKGNK